MITCNVTNWIIKQYTFNTIHYKMWDNLNALIFVKFFEELLFLPLVIVRTVGVLQVLDCTLEVCVSIIVEMNNANQYC